MLIRFDTGMGLGGKHVVFVNPDKVVTVRGDAKEKGCLIRFENGSDAMLSISPYEFMRIMNLVSDIMIYDTAGVLIEPGPIEGR